MEEAVLNPSIAMPALFTRISIPSSCSFLRKSRNEWMLLVSLMSSARNLIVVSPPSCDRTFAAFSCGSRVRTFTASAPREAERAVR